MKYVTLNWCSDGLLLSRSIANVHQSNIFFNFLSFIFAMTFHWGNIGLGLREGEYVKYCVAWNLKQARNAKQLILISDSILLLPAFTGSKKRHFKSDVISGRTKSLHYSHIARRLYFGQYWYMIRLSMTLFFFFRRFKIKYFYYYVHDIQFIFVYTAENISHTV